DIIRKTSDAYEQAIIDEPRDRDNIKRAHRNLLRQAVYFLYEFNRVHEATEWFNYLIKNYPNDNLLTGNPNSKPTQMTLDEYAVARVQEDVKDTSRDRTEAVIEGRLADSYKYLVMGDDDRATGNRLLAQKVWQSYQAQIPAARMDAIGLRPFKDIDHELKTGLLNPETGWPPEVRAILRSRTGMPPEEIAPTDTNSTNAAPVVMVTNLPPAMTATNIPLGAH
ncbi:MAG TPA: hypothetical protein VH255_00820, partial [Verrucomicrobiae bacterium]|nr:hypothetical protein [Verrucomicrobiae bacterium]